MNHEVSNSGVAETVRSRVTAWLDDAERPGYGRVTRFESWDLTPDGSHAAAVGTVLSGIDHPARNVLCVIETGSGDCEQYDLPASCVACGPDVVAVASGSDVHWLDLTTRALARGPALSGRVEQLSVSSDGQHVLAVIAPEQPQRYDLAERVHAEPTDWRPLVFTADPERSRRCFLVDRQSGAVRDVTPSGLNVWEVCWAGPSSALAVCSETPGESGWYSPHLALIDLPSAKAEPLYTPQTGRQLAKPVWTRVRSAVIEATCSDRGVAAGEVIVLGPGRTPQVLDTHGVDVSVLHSATGDNLVYAGLRELETVVGTVNARAALVTETWSTRRTFHGRTPDIRTDRTGRLHGVLESYEDYPRLVVIENEEIRTVFDLGHSGVDAVRGKGGRMEEVSWTSPDGQEIQGLLVLPDGPPPHPLVVNVHGGPVSAWRNRWGIATSDRYPLAPLLASEGYAVLHPNPRGSHGRGERFARAVLGDMLGAPVQDLLSGVDHLIAEGLVDPTRIAVTGTSYGAVMSLVLPAVDQRFAAAIAVSPVSDWVSQHYTSNIPQFDELFLQDTPDSQDSVYFHQSPLFTIGRIRTPTLLTAGLRDKCTPPQQAVEAHQALLRNGIDTELVLYPRQGHGVRGFPETADYLTRILTWLQRYLPAHRCRRA